MDHKRLGVRETRQQQCNIDSREIWVGIPEPPGGENETFWNVFFYLDYYYYMYYFPDTTHFQFRSGQYLYIYCMY